MRALLRQVGQHTSVTTSLELSSSIIHKDHCMLQQRAPNKTAAEFWLQEPNIDATAESDTNHTVGENSGKVDINNYTSTLTFIVDHIWNLTNKSRFFCLVILSVTDSLKSTLLFLGSRFQTFYISVHGVLQEHKPVQVVKYFSLWQQLCSKSICRKIGRQGRPCCPSRTENWTKI